MLLFRELVQVFKAPLPPAWWGWVVSPPSPRAELKRFGAGALGRC